MLAWKPSPAAEPVPVVSRATAIPSTAGTPNANKLPCGGYYLRSSSAHSNAAAYQECVFGGERLSARLVKPSRDLVSGGAGAHAGKARRCFVMLSRVTTPGASCSDSDRPLVPQQSLFTLPSFSPRAQNGVPSHISRKTCENHVVRHQRPVPFFKNPAL